MESASNSIKLYSLEQIKFANKYRHLIICIKNKQNCEQKLYCIGGVFHKGIARLYNNEIMHVIRRGF